MEKRIKKTCVHPSSCVTCSLFNFTDPFFATVVDIKDECTTKYQYKTFKPITQVYINGNLEEEFNQTRCCEGSRTLLYKIEKESTDALTSFPTSSSVETTYSSSVFFTTTTQNLDAVTIVKENASATKTTILPSLTSSQSIDIPILLTAAIVGVVFLFVVLLCVIVVKCKRKSKTSLGMQNLQRPVENEIYSDGVAEYSTVEETATIVKSLIHTKTRSRGTENKQDNYFILEKIEASSNACEKTYKTKHIPSTEEDIYNKLHEKERRSTEIEESVYSHFSDCNENVYSETIRR
ncbi:uncharacterized protein LOC133197481 isoform X2 [Saccostrea echinata]|nr:uncharacterized protein LOC133197481 isoform X2 [Saccostrea echinata]